MKAKKSKQKKSIKLNSSDKNSFQKSFGAFKSKKSADEIIEEIKSSRAFNRQIEKI